MNVFSSWMNAEDDYMKFWGNSDNPSLSMQEYVDKCKRAVLDYINQAPQPLNEAADRGTCLNEIVDCLIGSEPNPSVWWDKIADNYQAERNGFRFEFYGVMVDQLVMTMRNAIPQYHLSYTYTPDGCGYDIYLHGYADYIFPTQIWDLKTTSKYESERYRDNWQRLVYPVIAVDSGDMLRCDLFGFHVMECRKSSDSGVITAEEWKETYDVNIADARSKIMEFLTGVMIPQLDKWNYEGMTPQQTICHYD